MPISDMMLPDRAFWCECDEMATSPRMSRRVRCTMALLPTSSESCDLSDCLRAGVLQGELGSELGPVRILDAMNVSSSIVAVPLFRFFRATYTTSAATTATVTITTNARKIGLVVKLVIVLSVSEEGIVVPPELASAAPSPPAAAAVVSSLRYFTSLGAQ